jgi:hypothetical protein
MADNTQSAPPASHRRGGKSVFDDIPHVLQPWLTCATAPPVAFAAHELWANDSTMHTGLGGLAVLVTGVTWASWSRRHEHTRAMATAFAGSITGWTAVASGTSMGFGNHPLWDAWILGTLALAGSWNIVSASHNRKHEADKPSDKGDGLLKVIGGALENAKVRRTNARKGRVEADIELQPGNEGEAVQQQTGEIASHAGIGKDQVTVVPNKRNARKVRVVFQDTENLRETIAWPGAGKLGRSVADEPLVIGLRADGSKLLLWLVGAEDPKNPRQLPHTLVTGVNGSGKTETLNTIIVRLRECRDVVPIVGDPAKFAQSFGNVADALGIAAKGKPQVNRLIRNIAPAIEYRAELLGNLPRRDGTIGYSQWEPECYTEHGIPLVVIDIEEATDVLGTSDDEFDEAVRKARSVGIALIASLQSAHHGNIERKTRGQFTNSLCHGCREQYDAKFALSSATLEAGADPTKWQNNFAGSLYGELVGTDASTWAMESRAFYLDRVTKRAELEKSRANGHWAVLDHGTAMALGAGIEMPNEKISAMLPGVPADIVDSVVEARKSQVSALEDAMPETEDDAPLSDVVTTEDGEQVDVSRAIQIPQNTRPFAAREDRPKLTTEQARALVAEKIDALEAAGQDEITFADLEELVPLTGRRAKWIYEELKRLEGEGRLVASNGRAPYRLKQRVNGFARV